MRSAVAWEGSRNITENLSGDDRGYQVTAYAAELVLSDQDVLLQENYENRITSCIAPRVARFVCTCTVGVMVNAYILMAQGRRHLNAASRAAYTCIYYMSVV